MRFIAVVLLLFASSAFAKNVPCLGSCRQPATFVSIESKHPYNTPVRSGGEVKGMWLWVKAAEFSRPCTAAQLVEISDKVACQVKIGEVLFVTSKFQPAPSRMRRVMERLGFARPIQSE